MKEIKCKILKQNNELVNDNYYPSKYNIFIIKDPKYRIIMSLSIKDKIVNNYIAKNILIKKLDKYLDTRIIATRKNYGAYYGIKLIKKYLNNNLKLEVNKKKPKIVSIKDGFVFLGYRFLIKNNKTIIKIKSDTLKKIKRRVKELNYLYNNYIKFNKVFYSLNTYLYSFNIQVILKQ